jgi:uncharacterized lipoprotein YmbA
MATRRAVLSGVIASVVSVAGCASVNPTLYTLAPVPGAARGAGPRVVVLRQVGLPRYLDRSQIVRSSDNYRLDIDASNWWGEPLGAMIARVLEEELSERLPGTSVFSDTGAIAAEADATVEVNIQRMDADAAGTVILAAQAAVVFTGARKAPHTRAVRFTAQPPSPGVQGEVAAISVVLGQLADTVAAMLRR